MKKLKKPKKAIRISALILIILFTYSLYFGLGYFVWNYAPEVVIGVYIMIGIFVSILLYELMNKVI